MYSAVKVLVCVFSDNIVICCLFFKQPSWQVECSGSSSAAWPATSHACPVMPRRWDAFAACRVNRAWSSCAGHHRMRRRHQRHHARRVGASSWTRPCSPRPLEGWMTVRLSSQRNALNLSAKTPKAAWEARSHQHLQVGWLPESLSICTVPIQVGDLA